MPSLDSDHLRRRDQLRTVLHNYFTSDDAELLRILQSAADYVELVSGEVLLRQGEISDEVYFVLSGRLRAFAETEPGVTKALSEIGRGETIGELALFTGEPRSASIVAVRDSLLLKVTRAMIERAIMQNPEVEISMTRLVIRRFRRGERERQTPVVPVNICILPITAGIDAAGFARALREAQGSGAGSIAVPGYHGFLHHGELTA